MKKNFLFSLLAVFLAWFWFGGVSMAEEITEWLVVNYKCSDSWEIAYTVENSGTWFKTISLSSNLKPDETEICSSEWKDFKGWKYSWKIYPSISRFITGWVVTTVDVVIEWYPNDIVCASDNAYFKIWEKCYSDLDKAISDTDTDEITITLNKTIDNAVAVKSNKKITFELWENSINYWFSLPSNANVILNWWKIGWEVRVFDHSKLTVNWTEISSDSNDYWILINDNSEVTIEEWSKISSNTFYAISFHWATQNIWGNKLTINWWTFITKDNCTIWTHWNVSSANNIITINWWTFTSSTTTAWYIPCWVHIAEDDTLNISGWTFNVEGWVWIVARWWNITVDDAVVFNFGESCNTETKGHVWDSSIDIPACNKIVWDLKSSYPWAVDKWVTINAKEENITRLNYEVVFKYNDGTTADTITSVGNKAKVTKPEDPTKEWYEFIWWFVVWEDTEYDFTKEVTQNLVIEARWWHKIVLWSVSNWTISTNPLNKAVEWAVVTLSATPSSNYNFWTWTVKKWDENIPVTDNKFTMPDGDVEVTATFTAKPASYSWGWGSSRSSSKTTTTDDTKKVEDTSKTDETKSDETKTDESKADETKTSEEAKAAADAQALKDGYSQEFIDAYNFARKNNITTKDTIREADMDAPLTRIAMAKMLSQYAINVLGKTPDTSIVVPTFPDVDAKLDADYNNWVTLAYQLGIMWINVDKYRPFDLVTRAEFGTALSRMLYGLSDGEWDQWYKTHLDKLMEEQIITNNNPNLQELRGYVMIMLMRSAQ